MTIIGALSLCVCSLLLGHAQSVEEKIPTPLIKAHQARLAPKTGSLKYAFARRFPGQVEQKNFFEARFAGDRIYIKNFGDADGIRMRQPDGAPLLGVMRACLPEEVLYDPSKHEVWRYDENDISVSLVPPLQALEFHDPRALGLHCALHMRESPMEMLNRLERKEGEVPLRFKTWKTNNLINVNGSTNENSSKPYPGISWLIDPARDYAILAVEYVEKSTDGSAPQRVAHLEADYDHIDGYWWPRRIESTCERTGFHFLFELSHAEFDKPEQPKTLDADMFGIPPGTIVLGPEFNLDTRFGRYLGGGQAVTYSEWEQVKQNYNPEVHEAWQERMFRGRLGNFPAWWENSEETYGLKNVDMHPDDWETYVRRWIVKLSSGDNYKPLEPLEEKQKNAAWAVLADCKKRVFPLVESRKKELGKLNSELQRQRDAIKKLQSTPSGSNDLTSAAKSLRKMEEQAKSLAQPNPQISRIFAELKSRLDDLLTSQQRSPDNIPAFFDATKPQELSPEVRAILEKGRKSKKVEWP